MKRIPDIEPNEIDVAEVVRRLAERFRHRPSPAIFQLLRRIQADPGWIERVARAARRGDVP